MEVIETISGELNNLLPDAMHWTDRASWFPGQGTGRREAGQRFPTKAFPVPGASSRRSKDETRRRWTNRESGVGQIDQYSGESGKLQR
ncbi:MAG: hypothetical protein ACYCTV_05245 [Leptospirales bacterium]